MNSKSKLLAPELVNAERPVWAFSKKIFCEGMRDGVPIALGYFAVSFSLGIAARRAGFTPFQGFLVSLLNNASAGEYAGVRHHHGKRNLSGSSSHYPDCKRTLSAHELRAGPALCTGHALLAQACHRL